MGICGWGSSSQCATHVILFSSSAKRNSSYSTYSILFLTYTSYFRGKKGISRNKMKLFFLMTSHSLRVPFLSCVLLFSFLQGWLLSSCSSSTEGPRSSSQIDVLTLVIKHQVLSHAPSTFGALSPLDSGDTSCTSHSPLRSWLASALGAQTYSSVLPDLALMVHHHDSPFIFQSRYDKWGYWWNWNGQGLLLLRWSSTWALLAPCARAWTVHSYSIAHVGLLPYLVCILYLSSTAEETSLGIAKQ